MLAVFLEFNGINTEIFATIREARRWLTPADGWKTGAAAG
jgi:hypothetical protein